MSNKLFSFFSDLTKSEQEISGVVELSPEWKEFKPDPPLKSKRRIQYVGLELDNIKGWNERDRRKLIIDGKDVLIEIELFDEHGNKHALVPNRIGKRVEFGKPKEDISNQPSDAPDFPSDREYTKISIRSEPSVKCRQIIWGTYTPW